jgi:hypothetical protein
VSRYFPFIQEAKKKYTPQVAIAVVTVKGLDLDIEKSRKLADD